MIQWGLLTFFKATNGYSEIIEGVYSAMMLLYSSGSSIHSVRFDDFRVTGSNSAQNYVVIISPLIGHASRPIEQN